MNEIKDLLIKKSLVLNGPIYQNSVFDEFKVGQRVGELSLNSNKIKIFVNRTLQSLLNPQAVARDVFNFVNLQEINPDIQVDAAYSSHWNFIGKPIEGYLANKCYLTTKAAKALNEAQKELAKKGYSLLVLDCYRPQRAVNQFVNWTKDGSDTKMQSQFYPDEPKINLIKRGYIDDKSGHSRGSTVDVTMVKKDLFKLNEYILKKESMKDCRISNTDIALGLVDMGTSFDCFSELAQTANATISSVARKNRYLLKTTLEKHGFKNYEKEWWHFVLKDEPYKKDYFDFEIQ